MCLSIEQINLITIINKIKLHKYLSLFFSLLFLSNTANKKILLIFPLFITLAYDALLFSLFIELSEHFYSCNYSLKFYYFYLINFVLFLLFFLSLHYWVWTQTYFQVLKTIHSFWDKGGFIFIAFGTLIIYICV